jgi:hypothetical protein
MKLFCMSILLVSLIGCTSTNVDLYKNEKPVLQLDQYFNGKLKGYGVVMNRSGEVTRRFVVAMDATWQNNIGTLKEDFEWSDGEKSQRVWTINKLENNQFQGKAPDVDGAADGKSAGNAFNWTYKINLKVKDSSYNLKFDDWMYLVDDKVLINEATMYWYGFRAGKILISFNKP